MPLDGNQGQLNEAVAGPLQRFVGRRYFTRSCTPADVYFGRQYTVLTERDKIKRLTMKRRKKEYFANKAA